jgi:cytidylate kinase
MIVTIDGPAAAGKSSTARTLAERIGFDYLDTGAMYRAVTLAALRRSVPLDDEARLEELAESVRITLRGARVFLDGEDVTQAIRDPQVTRLSRHVADSPAVRRRMVVLQREVASARNIVTEGRDQGTVVFPDAACKFFLTAEPQVRACRRQRELAARGQEVSVAEVLSDQTERDQRDANRAIAPMVPASNAILIDSSQMSLDQVVASMERYVQLALGLGAKTE